MDDLYDMVVDDLAVEITSPSWDPVSRGEVPAGSGAEACPLSAPAATGGTNVTAGSAAGATPPRRGVVTRGMARKKQEL